jgi:hypothetical protein
MSRQSRTADRARPAQFSIVHLGGDTPAMQILLDHVYLGNSAWNGLKAVVLQSTQLREHNGTLGIAALGLARIHFDFAQCLISWEK